jgi:ppGpp synthetase/RelA/SpoT-type nucleotidyltranferase
MTQSSINTITSFLEAKNRVKYSPSLLDKASRYFETNIGQKYGYKIIKIIDIGGLRFVVAKKNQLLYLISLIILERKSISSIGENNINRIREITLSIAQTIGFDVAASWPIII